MKIKTEYDLEDKVYMKSDPYQTECIVVGFIIRPGQNKVEVSDCGNIYELYEFEISKEKDITKALFDNSVKDD